MSLGNFARTQHRKSLSRTSLLAEAPLIELTASLSRPQIVPESDDPTLPTLTFRVFLLGTILCIVGASVSQLFFFKSNAPSFSSFFVILIAFPLGHALTHILPESLNTGPFNKKEHLLIGVLA